MAKYYITAIAAVLVGLIAYFSDVSTSSKTESTELVKVLYDRVKSLETNSIKVNQINHEQANSILKLRLQLATKYEPDDAVKAYIDNMPFPAWVKVTQGEVDAPEFVMWYLNESYESTFNKTRELYIGNTDFDIWPDPIAKRFYAKDLAVLSTYDSLCEDERMKYTPVGPKAVPKIRDVIVCKWNTTINGKRAVAGQVMPM